MSYEDLGAAERITVINLDLMSDKEFSRIGATTQIGQSHITGPERATACTDGLDRWYNEQWVMGMTRRQVRYVVAHECLHMQYQHCSLYIPEAKAYPKEFAMAIDYVVNLAVEDMDAGRGFVERPTDIPPLIDEKYRGWNCMEVLADLIKNPPKPPPPQGGKPQGGKPQGGESAPGGTLDEHVMRPAGDGDPAAAKDEAQTLDDARIQGEMTSARMRGVGAGSAALQGFEETQTEWREPMRQFLEEHVQGDDQSRWNPRNKLFVPLGISMPSHYSEAVGDLLVACDTSGSMRRYYASIFGEIGRLCEQLQPLSVTVLWWDARVQGTQRFQSGDYPTLASKLKAVGGGGTHVSCVAKYMADHKLKPQATIILTDGMLESGIQCPPGPLLWGVVGTHRFLPPRGKLLRISKERL